MPEIQMSLEQISSGCFSDLSGCINIIFNFLSEVEIFAILLNMEHVRTKEVLQLQCLLQLSYSSVSDAVVISNWSSVVQWSPHLASFGYAVFQSHKYSTTPRKDFLLPVNIVEESSLLGMQNRITLVLKDLPAVCRLLHDCISQNDRISNFFDTISNFVIQKYSKFLRLQIKGSRLYSLTGILETLKIVFLT